MATVNHQNYKVRRIVISRCKIRFITSSALLQHRKTTLRLWLATLVAASFCATVSVPVSAARAWGAIGHEWVSSIAIELLPDDLPDFLRTPEAVANIALLGRELDRSNGSGATHDKERDPRHHIDLADDGSVFGLPRNALPTTREEYGTALRDKGMTQYKAGNLPVVCTEN
jgi:hypothetical protein